MALKNLSVFNSVRHNWIPGTHHIAKQAVLPDFV